MMDLKGGGFVGNGEFRANRLPKIIYFSDWDND
jgi:hypothetical protein